MQTDSQAIAPTDAKASDVCDSDPALHDKIQEDIRLLLANMRTTFKSVSQSVLSKSMSSQNSRYHCGRSDYESRNIIISPMRVMPT